MKTVHFEYLGEDIEVPGAVKWKVEAIHVTTTRNKRKFTITELREAGRSLSFRPLDINHDPERNLPFPENKTLHMSFNENKMAVEGIISVADQEVNAQIESGKISTVSIEQIPSRETCNEILCEQHGVAFIGLGLLERGVLPGDIMAGFHGKAESIPEPISNMIVSDEQRTCMECTDMVPCHTCYHKKKQFETAQEKLNEEIDRLMSLTESQKKTKEQVIAQAIAKLNNVTLDPKTSWALFRTGSETYDFISTNGKKKEADPIIDASMQTCLEQVQKDHPELNYDQRILHCMELLNRMDKPGPDITIQINNNGQDS